MGLLQAGIRTNHKLLATEARGYIAQADAGGDDLGHLSQHLVAAFVPHRVVEFFLKWSTSTIIQLRLAFAARDEAAHRRVSWSLAKRRLGRPVRKSVKAISSSLRLNSASF